MLHSSHHLNLFNLSQNLIILQVQQFVLQIGICNLSQSLLISVILDYALKLQSGGGGQGSHKFWDITGKLLYQPHVLML